MSPVDWAGSVSEISARLSSIRKNLDVFISEAGMKILPYIWADLLKPG